MKRYLLAETALLLILPFLFFFAGTQAGLASPTVLPVTAGLFSLLWLAQVIWGRHTPIPLGLPLAAFFGALALSCLVSIDPRRSVVELWLLGLALLLFWTTVWLVRRKVVPGELIVKTGLVVGAIFMLLCWNGVLAWYRTWLGVHPGEWLPDSTYRLPSPNFVCVMLNVWLMFALARLVLARAWPERLLLGAWALSALGLIYLTSSRGGWLGALAGLGLLAWVTLGRERRRLGWQRLRSWAARPLRLGLLGVFGLLALLPLAWLGLRQLQHPSHAPFLSSRSELWLPAWRAFLASPLWGRGIFTYISAYVRQNPVPPLFFFDYAHNIYLDLLSGAGILGLAAFVWLIIAFFKLGRACLPHLEANERSVWLGALAAATAFLVHGLFDSVHHTTPTSAWNLALLLGAACGINIPSATPPLPTQPSVWSRLTAGGLVCALTWLNLVLLLPMQAGVEALNRGDLPAAQQALTEATRGDPWLAPAHQQLGLAYALDAAPNPAKLEPAIAAFERTVQLDPAWALNHANLGALYAAAGRLPGAQAELGEACRLSPKSPYFALNLGIIEEKLGRAGAAEKTYRRALDLQPAWSDSPFWQESPLRRRTLVAWQTDRPPAAQVDPAALVESVSAHSPLIQDYLSLATFYLDRNLPAEAAPVLAAAHLAYSDRSYEQIELHWLEARLAAAQGNLPRAVQLGESVLKDMQTQGIWGSGATAGPSYTLYGFRRPAAAIDFVPQLIIPSPGLVFEERQAEVKKWKF